MKNIYNKHVFLIFSMLLFFCLNNTFAQKNLKLRITSIAAATSSGTNCDANCVGLSDNQIDWVWDIDDGSTDVDEDCFNLSDDANSNSNTPNFNVWDRNYDYGCQWPTGNINLM
jgi:hypothetical protein